MKQFIGWARAQGGKANFASGGIGASTHLYGELLNSVDGLDLLHVPYKGSAPAVTGSKRDAALPDVQPRGPAAFADFARSESERWSALIAERGIKLD